MLLLLCACNRLLLAYVAAEFASLRVIYHIFSLTAKFQKNASVACDISSGATGANLQPLQSMFAFTARDGSVPGARV